MDNNDPRNYQPRVEGDAEYQSFMSQIAAQAAPAVAPPKQKLPISKPLIFGGVALLVLLAGTAVAVLLNKPKDQVATQTLKASDFSYTVKYNNVNNDQVEVDKNQYYTGIDTVTNQAMLISVEKTKLNYDCFDSVLSKVVTKITINGSQHAFCYSSTHNKYVSNFKHNNDWYVAVAIPRDSGAKLDNGGVQKVFESISVN